MRIFGAFLFLAALITLIIGFNLDTTVASGLGDGRVHNIGLMSQKQNVMIIGGAMAVAGAVLLGLASRTASASAIAGEGYRACPHCAELVKVEAKVCRFCQRDLPSMRDLQKAAEAEQEQLAELRKRDELAATIAEEQLSKGSCPNCEKTIPLSSLVCKHCKAEFGPKSAWRVRPIDA